MKKLLLFSALSVLLTACGPVDACLDAGGAWDHENIRCVGLNPYDDGHDEHHMAHEQYEVPGTMAIPNISIEVLPDPKSGWNLHILTENFEFDPENASLEHEDGKGHAHLYIFGHKITRIYSEWYHLPPDLFPVRGEYDIRVTLNTNDHKDYAVNGEVIEATTKQVVIPE